ncbi:MAG: Bug family tripartite tricarboxylate transporter substrate binding protein [Burkholderiales bacterium]
MAVQRLPNLAKVPTVAETLPGFVTGSWQGIVAPPRMPPQLVAKLNAEIVRIQKLPDVNELLMSQGTTPSANSSEETHRWFVEEKARWTKVVKDSGFKLD